MDTSHRRWAQSSFGSARFGDARRSRRFVQLMAEVAAQPAGQLTQVFAEASQRQAAYDFVEHATIAPNAVVQAVGEACVRDCASRDAVLVVLDGTSVVVTDRAASKGFGSIGARKYGSRGLKVLNALALDEVGVPLGLPTQRYWLRGEREKKRSYRRMEDRESAHWRHAADEVAARFERLAPHTKLHYVADREADAWLWMRHIVSQGHDFTIRARGTRKIHVGRRRIALKPALGREPVLARLWLHIPARAGRIGREARLELRAVHTRLSVRDKYIKELKVQELTVVWAREIGRPPRGEPRVEWLLYTTQPARTAADAYETLRRYTLRWRIEEMHRTWKSGSCNVEDLQLRSPAAAIKWACMLAAVAARIEKLKHLARATPDEPATIELSEMEIRALILMKRKQKKRTETVPPKTPSIAQAVRWIADLGGYIGPSNGPPGATVIARGFEKVLWTVEVLESLQRDPMNG